MTQSTQTDTYFELDPIIGWRASTSRLSAVDSVGLAVDSIPGQPAAFASALADQIIYPAAFAYDANGKKLHILDAAVDRIKVLSLPTPNQVTTVMGFGGKGRQARQLRNPRGLAVLSDGAYVIADTGNHQVKIFTGFPNALLSVWGSGRAGNGANDFNSPWKVIADSSGLIYIADRGNGRVQRIYRDGTQLDPILGLQNPMDLAINANGLLLVLDGAAVQVFAAGEIKPAQTLPVPDASCITLDASGYLYVGTSTALIYKFAPTSATAFRNVGIGVTGMSAQFIDLLWTPQNALLGILLPSAASSPFMWTIAADGAYVPDGSLMTSTLDSGIDNCSWHRIELDADIPSGTIIEVTTQTAQTDIWAANAPFTPDCALSSASNQSCQLTLTGPNPDCLVQSSPGRYLRLQLYIKTNLSVSPVLRAIRIHFPRQSYLQYLPAIYQTDDDSRNFLDRFLSIFQTTYDAFDRQIDNMWMMFDPYSIPDNWFPWLAAWLALPINPLWSDQERRYALKNACKVYPTRGTPAGIVELIKEYAGIDARLVEHFQLRQLIILRNSSASDSGTDGRLWSRDYYQRLQVGVYSRIGYFRLSDLPDSEIEPLRWGANEFSVLFDCDPYLINETRQKVAQIVEREKPAYTKANYCPVLPRMRVGLQSTLGVDTRIGIINPLLLGATGMLGYDSILGCSETEAQILKNHATLRPQVDINSRLL